ncbi:MAG: hypothetical protein AB8H12_14980, partial [Lewinella sp.]
LGYLRQISSCISLLHRSLGYGQAPSLRLIQNNIFQQSPQKLILDTLLERASPDFLTMFF